MWLYFVDNVLLLVSQMLHYFIKHQFNKIKVCPLATQSPSVLVQKFDCFLKQLVDSDVLLLTHFAGHTTEKLLPLSTHSVLIILWLLI